ncbi:hypothetical protein BK816_07165 [Boudabousia tangfeifanii]|uniref:Nucleotide modification associated domain-containing protein n=1 Tax=Boudabousia tangfeifanii TaxID=1912795 RepID=A0A1D9MLF3_9ACTO|nr:hypothetical protein [Boudabousia tangfeifanii]AOZ73095.1 hypothetical protein BK816_07165 [Boudabousia tangfeifanii]
MNTTKTTMETLAETTAQRIILQHGDRVLVATYRYFDGTRNGWQAETYRLVEAPIPGWGKDARPVSECALSLEAASDEYFADNGSAIAWAMNN